MNALYRFLSLGFIASAILISCNKDKTYSDCSLEYCVTGAVSYEDHIKPLIQQSCATNLGPGTGCHDAWIFNYDNIKKSVEDGIFGSVIADESMPMMPNNFGIEPLTQEEKEMFACWICDGALDN